MNGSFWRDDDDGLDAVLWISKTHVQHNIMVSNFHGNGGDDHSNWLLEKENHLKGLEKSSEKRNCAHTFSYKALASYFTLMATP